ncbi:ABC transporter substrate-binding protein [Phytoactinopolyspora halotolerans]|uniref:Carbohydrate ABC transporter substrate-binding protein n=1 Tax=Phytoactinopolyspora halotolerans TaxID=1981512 RepID=A0A6L9S3M7_9ACTN|nr:ABC transporter substrate-binding protein [Phytoactinopolyspora halotolerans]NED98569.1 carbohydrate ABC transporter substrate-binding protein [Phytoactinopolyspora halotolerans]
MTRYIGRRRFLAGASITAAAVLVTAGCGGTSATGETGDGQDTHDGTGEVQGDIVFAWWGGGARNEVTNAVADLFEEANPDVSVSRESADWGDYWDRLNVQASGGNMPCVTQTQARQLNDFASRNLLLPLDPMVESGAIDVSTIPDDVLDSGRGPDGELYMVPYGAAYDALMVNQTLAEETGAGVPPDGYDWEYFFDWLAEAQDDLPDDVAAANVGGGRPNYLIAYVQAHGEEMFADGQIGFPRELLVDFWTEWEELRESGVTNTADQWAEEPSASEQSYVAQGAVMADVQPGNYLTPAQDTMDGQDTGQQLVTVPLPSGPAGSGNVLITSGFSIPASCDNVSTAAAFVDFWINDDEGAEVFSSSNGAVTNADHLQQQIDNPELPELKRHELEVYEQIVGMSPPVIIYPPGYQATFEAAFTRAYEEIAFGRKSIEQAVDDFFAEANAGLG